MQSREALATFFGQVFIYFPFFYEVLDMSVGRLVHLFRHGWQFLILIFTNTPSLITPSKFK